MSKASSEGWHLQGGATFCLLSLVGFFSLHNFGFFRGLFWWTQNYLEIVLLTVNIIFPLLNTNRYAKSLTNSGGCIHPHYFSNTCLTLCKVIFRRWLAWKGPRAAGVQAPSEERGAVSRWELAHGALALTRAAKGSKQQRACKCEIVPELLLLLIRPLHGAGQPEQWQCWERTCWSLPISGCSSVELSCGHLS